MPMLRYPGWIVPAALMVALFTSTPAEAQPVFANQGPDQPQDGLVNNLLTGTQYDILNQAKAEQRIPYLQRRLRRDTDRGWTGAANRDARLINTTNYRIAVDGWLIRKNTLRDFGYYPLRTDPVEVAALAEVARPAEGPDPYRSGPMPGPNAPSPAAATPAVTSPSFSITIANASGGGTDVSFSIDGEAHQMGGGARQDFTASSSSTITYDGAGSVVPRRYTLSPGVFEFRMTPEGWALYKLPATP